MKNLIVATTVAFFVTAIPAYLLGSFLFGGFDFREWHPFGRIILGVSWMAAFCILSSELNFALKWSS